MRVRVRVRVRGRDVMGLRLDVSLRGGGVWVSGGRGEER